MLVSIFFHLAQPALLRPLTVLHAEQEKSGAEQNHIPDVKLAKYLVNHDHGQSHYDKKVKIEFSFKTHRSFSSPG
jgi:hypothetical protein